MRSRIIGLLVALLAAGTASGAEAPSGEASGRSASPSVSDAGASSGPETGSADATSSDVDIPFSGGYGKSILDSTRVGYDWRSGSFIFGLVEDAWSNPAVSVLSGHISANGVRDRLDTQLSLRGRVGYTFGSIMLYFTGGVEAVRVAHDFEVPFVYKHYNFVAAAPTAGVGLEYALDKRLSAFTEFRAVSRNAAPQAASFAPLGVKKSARQAGAFGGIGIKLGF
jgi:opacity protein-like surface antigen